MSEIIYFDVPLKFRQAGEAYFGLMLRGLREHLREEVSLDEVSDLCEILDAVTPVPLATLVNAASPQLWLYIRKIYSVLPNERDKIPRILQRLQVAVFDSFWRLLPDGISIPLQAENGEILLPSVGIRLHLPTANLGRIGEELGVRLGTSMQPILESGIATPINIIQVSFSRAQVIAEESETLFDEFSFPSVAGHGTMAEVLASQLAEAFCVVQQFSPRLGEEIRRQIRWFVPLKSIGPSIHSSHTSLLLPGAMFLSASKDPTELAEAVVHEFGHNNLNCIENASPLIDGNDEEKYYSPWRRDKRPLRGLMHALYVFCGVAAFLKALEDHSVRPDHQRHLHSRRTHVVHRLRIALRQIPEESLADFGKSLLKLVSSWTDVCSDGIDVSHSALPRAITEHFQVWQQENPHLIAVGPSVA